MRKLFSHIIIWIAAFSILNSSTGIPGIEAKDFGNDHMQALSNWNEFESMYEWVAEKALGIKNAVPENHNRHANQHSVLKKHAPVYVILRLKKPPLLHGFLPTMPIPVCEEGSKKPLSGFITLFSPPPDAARV